jgi:hypothetical protein
VTVSGLGIMMFGVIALTFMMVMYALEGRHPRFVVAFAVGCLLSSGYGFLSGAWPFGVVELLWTGVALRRYLGARPQRPEN